MSGLHISDGLDLPLEAVTDEWQASHLCLECLNPVEHREHIEGQLRHLLHAHREQRAGYSAATTGCSCGWAPFAPTKPEHPSLMQQYLSHVVAQIVGQAVKIVEGKGVIRVLARAAREMVEPVVLVAECIVDLLHDLIEDVRR